MNTQPSRHPDDETLFDYAAGALDAAAAAEIAHHVERCAACAGFLTAAARGGELLGATAEPMPGPAAERMHLKLADAWLEQHPPEPAVLPTTPLRPTRRERSQGTWRRRAVPMLACAVLAILAGTSYVLVDDDGGVSSKRATPGRARAGDGATRDDSTAGDTAVTATPSTSPASPDAQGRAGSAESDIGAEATGAGAGANKATGEAPATAPGAAAPTGIPSIGTNADGASIALTARVCIPGHDASTIVLPDGRYPMQVIKGPLGIVIVCG